MSEDNLTPDSKFYRYTKKSHIIEHKDGSLTITANSNPPEMIIDLYDGQGHTFRADSVGQGLSFTTKEEQDYRTDETVSVKLKLKDILDQAYSRKVPAWHNLLVVGSVLFILFALVVSKYESGAAIIGTTPEVDSVMRRFDSARPSPSITIFNASRTASKL